MSWIKSPSKYAQRMARLSCRIFGEYYKPPMPKEIALDPDKQSAEKWEANHYQNMAAIETHSKLPIDIDPDRNPNYYPPHPQIRHLMWVLREHGLYRNEHLDFIEEMKRIRILRGKKPRTLGGMSGKRAALKK
ncbi:28S ribosomal protein S33-like protein [Dinothrombium tinctorium]|uniref:Small ribosomal subunit protein mS33 n=1 Tax=Dinothrombium tinctorium TaxID=1965070 RepID=A0A3S3S5F7_9ACAR|nr:28S ribosomal protein S33-like protein [Dinothrombium tinctorium]